MDRSIQPSLMIVGCAALIITAALLPALILRPSAQVAPIVAQPVKQVLVTPITPAPVIPAPVISAPVTAAPLMPAPVAAAPAKTAADDDSLVDADSSRGQRFTLMQQEAMKLLGPNELAAALPKAFAFPHVRDDALFGVDVSHHNSSGCDCKINWDRVAQQKVAFVYVKSSEGTRSKDSQFKGHWDELAKIPNVYRGAYHFLSADDDIEAQVDFFLKLLGPLRANDLPPAMDLEWDIYPGGRKFTPRDPKDYWANIDSEEIIRRALKWLELVEKKTGRIPVVYTSREWWRGRIGDEKEFDRFKRYPLWLSAMASNDLRLEQPNSNRGKSGKWSEWELWQFTKMGDLTAAGVPNPKKAADERIDVSLFPGPLAEFKKKFGLVPAIVVADNTPTTSNAKPDNATTGGTPSEGGAAQPKEPVKENQATTTPDVGGKPANDNVATAGPGGGADPGKEPPRDQVATGPTDPNAGKNTGAEGRKPARKRHPKSASAVTEPPAEPPVSSNPETDNTGKPSEITVAKDAGKESGATAPKEPAKDNSTTGNPETDNTGKPSEITVTKNPGTDGGTTTPSEPAKDTPVAANPEPDSTTKPSDPKVAAIPAADSQTTPKEPAQDTQTAEKTAPSEPAKDTPVAANPEPDSTTKPAEPKAAANPGTDGQTTPKEPAQDTQTAEKTAPSEPAKDSPAAANPETDNPDKPAESKTASNAGTGTASEPPKETQTAGPISPTEQNEAQTPGTALPSRPPQVIRMPGADGSPGNPAEPTIATNPGSGGGTATSHEQPKEAATEKPSDSSVAANPGASGGMTSNEPPKNTQAATPPAPESATAKPSGPNVAVDPGAGSGTTSNEPPKDAQVASPPAPDSATEKPSGPDVAANPGASGGTVPPSEAPKEMQVAAVTKPESSGASSSETKAESKPATSGVAVPGTVASPDSKILPADPAAQKPMMEIVLKNGRVLRVETDTDPDKLLRLIALLEAS